jgi:hypothetical protein
MAIAAISNQFTKEAEMAVKIMIRRTVPEDKARTMIPLFKQMRQMAMEQTVMNFGNRTPGDRIRHI